jgi:hypothetical protein
MTRTSLRSGPRPLIALIAALAMLAGACGSDPADPQARLTSAFEETFDGAFAYDFSIDADRAALDTLGEGAGDAASFLGTFGFSGVVDDDDAVSFALGLGGGAQLIELRSFGDEAFYVNLGLNELLSLAGAGAFDPRDELAPALDALGFDAEVKAAVLDALDGKWVGVEGALDVERLRSLFGADPDTVDEDEIQAATDELFGEGLPGFFERFVTVEDAAETDDGAERFDVALQLRQLLRAAGELNSRVGTTTAPDLDDLEADLADLPEQVPGTVVVVDDHVTEIRFDVAGTAETDGSVLLTLVLSDFDEVEPLTRPEDATVLTEEQFTDAVERLVGLTGTLGPVD